jgi:5-methyltetrahydropteroyltriglutamate--homocysteine methyltransferase
MHRSTDRILTTHVGSLPRPADLYAMIEQKQEGGAIDQAAFAGRVKSAVAEIVKRQAEAGIDIVADGEMGRVGFIPYVNERLTGIEPSPGEIASYWNESREYKAFPEFYAWAQGQSGAAGRAGRTRWMCTGPVSYKGHTALAQDIANLKDA